MNVLRNVHFPPPVDSLLRSLSESGFFDRSLLIGSWVMPLYQEIYGAPYVLRTLDVDFAVHLAHPRTHMRNLSMKMRHLHKEFSVAIDHYFLVPVY